MIRVQNLFFCEIRVTVMIFYCEIKENPKYDVGLTTLGSFEYDAIDN